MKLNHSPDSLHRDSDEHTPYAQLLTVGKIQLIQSLANQLGEGHDGTRVYKWVGSSSFSFYFIPLQLNIKKIALVVSWGYDYHS